MSLDHPVHKRHVLKTTNYMQSASLRIWEIYIVMGDMRETHIRHTWLTYVRGTFRKLQTTRKLPPYVCERDLNSHGRYERDTWNTRERHISTCERHTLEAHLDMCSLTCPHMSRCASRHVTYTRGASRHTLDMSETNTRGTSRHVRDIL